MALLFQRRLFPQTPHTPPKEAGFGTGPEGPWSDTAVGVGTMFPFALTRAEAVWFFWRVRHWKLSTVLASGGGDITEESYSVTWSQANLLATSDDSTEFANPVALTTNADETFNGTNRRPQDLLNSVGGTRPFLNTGAFAAVGTSDTDENFTGDPPSNTSSTGTAVVKVLTFPTGVEAPRFSWLGRDIVADVETFYPPLEITADVNIGSERSYLLTGSTRGSGAEVATARLVLPGRSLDVPLYGSVISGGEGIDGPSLSTILIEAAEEWAY